MAPGSIYGTTAAAVAVPQRPLGEWNEFTIRVVHQSYAVALNGYDVATYENRDPGRGAPAPAFVGLQSYPGSRVGFRKIRIKPLRQPCRPTELAARRRPGRAAGHPGDHQLRLGREQPQLAEDPLDRMAGAVGGRWCGGAGHREHSLRVSLPLSGPPALRDRHIPGDVRMTSARVGDNGRMGRVLASTALAGVAATAVQFVRARNGYPWFGDLDPTGSFGAQSLPRVDLLLVGDSTCTGSGLSDPDEVWIRQLMPRLNERYHVRLSSTAVGGARVRDVIAHQLPQLDGGRWDVAFVSVGANDALRGLPMPVLERRVGQIVDRVAGHARVVLVAGMGDLGSPPRMLVPFNWLLRWRSWQGDRAQRRVVAARPGVRKVVMRANDDRWRASAELWSDDGFHPNRSGHALWAETIFPALEAAIEAAVAGR